MTNTTAAQDLRAVGMNDEQTECDRCGRVELRGTVIVADVAEGVEVGRYGTTCASAVLGVKVTRQSALSVEAYRRQNVLDDIRRARKAVEAGDWALARMYHRDAYRRTVVRPDEVRALEAVKAAVPAHWAAAM